MFISPAYAADTAGSEPSFLISLLPLLLVFLIFYFLIIRPQNKRMAAHREMINTLKRGDKVVTAGGVIATVKKLIGDDEVQLEIADGIHVTAVRSTLMTTRVSTSANTNAPENKPVKSGKKNTK